MKNLFKFSSKISAELSLGTLASWSSDFVPFITSTYPIKQFMFKSCVLKKQKLNKNFRPLTSGCCSSIIACISSLSSICCSPVPFARLLPGFTGSKTWSSVIFLRHFRVNLPRWMSIENAEPQMPVSRVIEYYFQKSAVLIKTSKMSNSCLKKVERIFWLFRHFYRGHQTIISPQKLLPLELYFRN